jgi:hypothetical protein
MNASDKRQLHLVVSGDVIVDHHLYQGERATPTIEHRRGVRDWRELGGAGALCRLMAQLFKVAGDESWQVHLGVTGLTLDETPCDHHAFATWAPFPKAHGDDECLIWRVQSLMGYGHPESVAAGETTPALCQQHPMRPVPELPPPRILVLDDAGSHFRLQARRECWLLPQDGEAVPDWILLKMSLPIAQGDLWHTLVERFPERLVCAVSADELRSECVAISRGLSWERTIEEVRDGLLSNPALVGLKRSRHLIVSFGADGALWLDRSDDAKPRATLCFDAGGAEGEWEERAEGAVVGSSATLTAALVYALARHVSSGADKAPDLAPAIEAGLAAQRNLHEFGHGRVEEALPTGFPVARLAEAMLKPPASFARALIPWPEQGGTLPAGGRTWMIVETSQRAVGSPARPSLVGLARQVALQGQPALKRLPHARFGALITADRSEIETLRNLRRLMLDYRKTKTAAKPFSLGVFGPPGAGKSFGVKQLAAEVFGPKAWLEFNLSQFNGPPDLIGAFHQVRDFVLSGGTPVVFWDEFDSREYVWLQYLLAPMQDGRFQEGQSNHAIGKCVFVFAGGTSPTFEEFGPYSGPAAPAPDDEASRRFRLRKGPDFKSRLDAYYNVAGPNRRTLKPVDGAKRDSPEPDPDDVCYPLRRALLIRSLLRCGRAERVDFDSDLLDAVLLAPRYTHGSRSLEKIILPLKPLDGRSIRRSSLPAPSQLAMHVDATAFVSILNRNQGFKMSEMIEPLAKAIHETWRGLSAKEGWKMQPQFDKPYADLAPIDKEDNRAAARRIPEILALAGTGVTAAPASGSQDEPSEADIRGHIDHHLERLSEAEHDGWMEQRLKNGWRYGKERDDANKIHPLLVPYADLPEKEKNKDRNSVRHFPDMVARAEFRIVWLEG